MNTNYQKIAQVANYLAAKEGGKIDRIKLVKLVFLADRYHVRKYGRLVTGDVYLAMEKGPVGSMVKDITGFSEFLGDEEKNYAAQYFAKAGDEPNAIVSLRKVDRDLLSESDEEALDFAYTNFGALTTDELVTLTHAYPEWGSSHVGAAIKSVPVNHDDFFRDPALMTDDKFKMDPENLKLSKEIYEHSEAVFKSLSI